MKRILQPLSLMAVVGAVAFAGLYFAKEARAVIPAYHCAVLQPDEGTTSCTLKPSSSYKCFLVGQETDITEYRPVTTPPIGLGSEQCRVYYSGGTWYVQAVGSSEDATYTWCEAHCYSD